MFINAKTEYFEITNQNATTTVKTNVFLTKIQTVYDSIQTPEYEIYCDNTRVYERSENGGLSPALEFNNYCGTIKVHQDNQIGTLDLYLSTATDTPKYYDTVSGTGTSTQTYYGDFFTQFLLLILILITVFSGVYNAIIGKKVKTHYYQS